MHTEDSVLFEAIEGVDGSLGLITLNRPQVLNSLNQVMIRALYRQLSDWASAKHIKAVVICAAPGRAFCAGGDLRSTYERRQTKDDHLWHFFYDEYHLNRLIFHYPKPYIAFLDGITMGGGVGISIHGSHRIATDRLVFAMPETGIGFFPDVGGSYFLPRFAHHIGFYLGLSGTKLSGDDCIAIGIATHKIASDSFDQFIKALASHSFGHDARSSVTNVLQSFLVPSPNSTLLTLQNEIEACFSNRTIEEIMDALQKTPSSFAKETVTQLLKKSPTSLKVSLQALQRGSTLSFDDCMRQEFRLARLFLQGHDFLEGIRAVIIDKDQMPKWKPATLSDVKQQDIQEYFEPLKE